MIHSAEKPAAPKSPAQERPWRDDGAHHDARTLRGHIAGVCNPTDARLDTPGPQRASENRPARSECLRSGDPCRPESLDAQTRRFCTRLDRLARLAGASHGGPTAFAMQVFARSAADVHRRQIYSMIDENPPVALLEGTQITSADPVDSCARQSARVAPVAPVAQTYRPRGGTECDALTGSIRESLNRAARRICERALAARELDAAARPGSGTIDGWRRGEPAELSMQVFVRREGEEYYGSMLFAMCDTGKVAPDRS
jgi:hypothetical protein